MLACSCTFRPILALVSRNQYGALREVCKIFRVMTSKNSYLQVLLVFIGFELGNSPREFASTTKHSYFNSLTLEKSHSHLCIDSLAFLMCVFQALE